MEESSPAAPLTERPTSPVLRAAVITGTVLAAGGATVLVVYLISAYWPWIIGVLTVGFVLFAAARVFGALAEREAQERAARLREIANLETVDAMNGTDFEYLTADLLRRDGYRSVEVVGRAGDRGVDVVAVAADGRRIAVQCKRQKKTVGSDRVRNLIGALHSTYAGHVGVLITSSTFTGSAIAEAEGHLILLDRERLAHWMDEHPLTI